MSSVVSDITEVIPPLDLSRTTITISASIPESPTSLSPSSSFFERPSKRARVEDEQNISTYLVTENSKVSSSTETKNSTNSEPLIVDLDDTTKSYNDSNFFGTETTMELPSPMYLGASHHDVFPDPTMNIQDMIDSDMKADFDDVLGFQGMDNIDMLHDLDSINILGEDTAFHNPAGSNNTHVPTTTIANGVVSVVNNSTLHQNNYVSFSNSYMEEISGSASVMVNPNNVMPIHHHPVQHQQVSSLSVNTQPMGGSSPLTSPMYPHPQQQQQQQHLGQQQQQPQHYQAKSVRVLPPVSSPMHQVPNSQHAHHAQPTSTTTTTTGNIKKKAHKQNSHHGLTNGTGNSTDKENGFPKPAYSYSCLIALALKNSHTGSMSVSEIYKFMCEHFPYFKNAPSGWKNSVRHNLSLNKCFEKIEKPTANGSQRKGCLWAMNPAKIQKMNEEVQKWSRKDPQAIKKGMAVPDTLPMLERGEMKKDYNANTTSPTGASGDSEDEEEPRTPTSVSSQGSQGYDSAGSDFVDIEGFSQITPVPDTSLPELSLQASGGNIYNDLADFGNGGSSSVSDVVVSSGVPSQQLTPGSNSSSEASFYPTATIRANYAITPAASTVSNVNIVNANSNGKTYHTVVNVAPNAKNQRLFTN